MSVDDLISRLAAQPAGAPPSPAGGRVAVALAAGAVASLALFAAVLGVRPSFPGSLMQPMTAAKTLLPLALGLLTLPVCLRLARPGQRAGLPGAVLLLVPAVAAVLVVLAFIGATEDRLTLFLGHSIQVCLPMIVILSAPIMAGLFSLLRRGAPERPGWCGALAGLASAGFATTLYSTFCTEDSPLFYVPWYGGGILLATLAGAWAGHRWLRW